MINNRKIRRVIDALSSKLALILGRLTPERKAILDAVRKELRLQNYLPVLFDFEKPQNRDLSETLSILAHMARFVIANLTAAKSVLQELTRIVPFLRSVPVQPILQECEREWAMYETFPRYASVLPIVFYADEDNLRSKLTGEVIGPAEGKADELTSYTTVAEIQRKTERRKA